jgi:hypothetical protein
MFIKVTKPQIKKLLEKSEQVELNLFNKEKDPNHFMTSMLVVDIKSIDEIEERLPKAFRDFSGHSQFSFAIWEDDK